MLRRLLAHPLTRGLDIDDPATTDLRREIVRSKPFLKRIYDEWYQKIAKSLPNAGGAVLEIGSGAGFLADYIPGLITSEIFPCQGVQVVLDGQALPFASGSLRGIVMTNVLHHIRGVSSFLTQAARCLSAGGALVMVEPWNSPWSRLIYTHLHHEPFCPEKGEWGHTLKGPLSGANGALPWIIFKRDRSVFESRFSELRVSRIEPIMPFRYLLSGGVSMRGLMPAWMFPIWKGLERGMEAWMNTWAMFAVVVVTKCDSADPVQTEPTFDSPWRATRCGSS
jgi:hypothetical protein